MGSKVRVELEPAEIGKLLKAPAVQALLAARAQRVAAAAGAGFVAAASTGATRARASVIAATPSARRREARDAVLIRALWAARG